MSIKSSALLGVESATVYRAAGRRWFTKRAACRALARKAVMARCECEPTYQWGPGSLDCTPGMTCWYHADADRYRKIIRRMARVYARTLTPNAPHQARAVASRPECGCSQFSSKGGGA